VAFDQEKLEYLELGSFLFLDTKTILPCLLSSVDSRLKQHKQMDTSIGQIDDPEVEGLMPDTLTLPFVDSHKNSCLSIVDSQIVETIPKIVNTMVRNLLT
jgi:hypothetical protein